ncbi:ABC transporter substrate-binding protein [Microbacterium stercoris]|uniref:ABC transporter substrate-binding protein n=1 Tax=Microbacterium stercoris TaxID=2820289 RepID=A0A939TXN3_9MICO|nr:ABC transporter substrate-binding protein [Microbacterium stercoris]MBO3663827.1 ABC transporter substrate-binding protein [Microbacterium stercoris]
MIPRSRLLPLALASIATLSLAACASGGAGDAPEETSGSAEATAGPACEPATEPVGEVGSELSLKLGSALPLTGGFAFVGPPEVAGIDYALSLINDYSSTTGLTAEVEHGDSGDLDNKAFETEIPRLLSEDVSAIIGAASSGVSLQFIDQLISAGVVQVSPANTSDAFTTYDDDCLYFRTAPSDVLQGAVHGNFIAELGAQSLGLIVMNDAYGTGIAKYITEAFTAAGGEVVAAPTFNPGDTVFDSQIQEVLAEKPDAISILAFAETKTILPSLIEQGFAPEDIFLVDANMAVYTEDFEPGLIQGVRGTYPGPAPDEVEEFRAGLDAFLAGAGDEALTDYTYAPEAFDAATLLALASLAAGSTDPEAIAGRMQEVSGGVPGGEKCTDYAACADIILSGGQADYDGVSSPVTFDEVGDPTEGRINIYEYQEDGTYVPYEG